MARGETPVPVAAPPDECVVEIADEKAPQPGPGGGGSPSTSALSLLFNLGRLLLLVLLQVLVWVTMVWACLCTLCLVFPLRVARWLSSWQWRRRWSNDGDAVEASSRLTSAISHARLWAQRPMLAIAFGWMVPLAFQEASYGIDFGDPTSPRPSSIGALMELLKGPGHMGRYRKRAKIAANLSRELEMKQLGVDEFTPGIEHRRVIWEHICSRNPTAHFIARAYYAGILVGALYCFSGRATEWREDGKLVGFSVLVKQGQYGVGTVFATTSSAARKGVWAQNLVGQYERLLEGGPDEDIALFDSGPTMIDLKTMWGLQALDRQRIIRMLFTGR